MNKIKNVIYLAIISVTFFGVAGFASAAYQPPIGIPAPSFGIDETVAGAYGSPSYYTHYVEATHPSASDSSNLNGSPDKPRRTIPNNLMPGSVVIVAGTYDYAPMGYDDITGTGTALQPIFIRGSSASSKPKIVRKWSIKGSYMILENLEFADQDGDLSGGSTGSISVASPSHHVAIRSSDIHGNQVGGGIGVASYDANEINNIVIHGNDIHDNGDWKILTDQDIHAITVNKRVNNLWVLDNRMWHNSGDAIQINAGTVADMPNTHHIYVGRNISWENKQTAYWSKQAVDVIFSQNTAYGFRPSPSSFGAPLGYQYGPERVWFLYNHIYDCENGIGSGSNSGPDGPGPGKDIYIIGNVIHNIHRTGGLNSSVWEGGAAIRLTDESAAKHVINNTIYDADAGIKSARGSGGLDVKNNIFDHIGGDHINIATKAVADDSLLNASLFGDGAKIIWGDSMQRSPLAAFTTAYPAQCTNCSESAPLFVNPSLYGFYVTVGSPAIDKGDQSNVYALFESLYGLSIAVDHNGNTRPRGSAWDIGAYEYGADAVAPSAPTGLVVQ